MTSPQASQGLLGNAALLPRKLTLTGGTWKPRAEWAGSRLFRPGAAPTGACHLFAGKQRTAASFVGGLALVQRAIGAVLAGDELGVLLDVHTFALSDVTKCDGLGILFIDESLGLRASSQRCAASSQRHQNDATVGGHIHGKLLERLVRWNLESIIWRHALQHYCLLYDLKAQLDPNYESKKELF
jgi:hypothetical protein